MTNVVNPPDGWLGKPHACHLLSQAATGSVLVFVDADVILEPTAIAACVEFAQRQKLWFGRAISPAVGRHFN